MDWVDPRVGLGWVWVDEMDPWTTLIVSQSHYTVCASMQMSAIRSCH